MESTTKTQTFEQRFPVVSETIKLDGREYKFCSHCRLPKAIAQILTEGKYAGMDANCANGLSNYDRLAARGKLAPRPGTKLVQETKVIVGRIVTVPDAK